RKQGAGCAHRAAPGGSARDLRFLPGHERDRVDVCDPGGGGQSGARTRLHGGIGSYSPEGILVVRRTPGHRRHRSADRFHDSIGGVAVLQVAGRSRVSERDQSTTGEPGTVAVTVADGAAARPSYKADLKGAAPKLRVKDLSVTYR